MKVSDLVVWITREKLLKVNVNAATFAILQLHAARPDVLAAAHCPPCMDERFLVWVNPEDDYAR